MIILKVYLTICWLIGILIAILMVNDWEEITIGKYEEIRRFNKYIVGLIVIVLSPILVPIILFMKDNE